jgi:hypothetical protein
VVDLETTVRTLYVQKRAAGIQNDAPEIANQDFERLKTEQVALLEECATLKQKLSASAKDASLRGDMDKQLQKAQEMCEQLRKEAFQSKSDASLLQARAECAEKQLQQAEQDLKIANAKQHQLQESQEKCEKLQKDLLHATNNVNLLRARAEVAEKQLQQAEHDSIASEQDALCGALAEQERLKTVIRGLEGALDTANQQIAHTTKQLQAANDLSTQAMQEKKQEEIWKGRAESAEKMLLQAEQDLRVSTERQQRAVETLERLRTTIRLGSLRALKLAG